jgi:CRP-like cAMP-binding protein
MEAGRVVDHGSGDPIFTIGSPYDGLTFPLTGLVSITVDTTDGQTVEVAVTGREGFAGVSRYLGARMADSNAVVQVPGTMLHVESEVVLGLADGDAQLRSLVNLYINGVMVEMAQSAVCNQLHSVEQRTSRWLLHASDRAGTTDLRLTHEFLAQMLAVRRPSVTGVVGIFNRAGLTATKRGLITVADREGLAELTCECYGIVRAATPTYD